MCQWGNEGAGQNSHSICDHCSLFSSQYFVTMLFSLAVVAWIGQQVHNLFLTYLIGKGAAGETEVTFLLAAQNGTRLLEVIFDDAGVVNFCCSCGVAFFCFQTVI